MASITLSRVSTFLTALQASAQIHADARRPQEHPSAPLQDRWWRACRVTRAAFALSRARAADLETIEQRIGTVDYGAWPQTGSFSSSTKPTESAPLSSGKPASLRRLVQNPVH
jgi:hypothetical protein